MVTATGLLGGVVLGLGLVYWARHGPPVREGRVYALGLLAAALIYVGFAALAGGPRRSLALEGLGVLGFGTMAWLGRERRAALLAAGWAAHVPWDLLLHLGDKPGAAYTPDWYPWVCVSFDLVIAGAIIVRPRRLARLTSAA